MSPDQAISLLTVTVIYLRDKDGMALIPLNDKSSDVHQVG